MNEKATLGIVESLAGQLNVYDQLRLISNLSARLILDVRLPPEEEEKQRQENIKRMKEMWKLLGDDEEATEEPTSTQRDVSDDIRESWEERISRILGS